MWRLIDTGTGSAAWNMAVDEALLEGFGENDLPILRLYGWENALSFGRFSKPRSCIDVERVEQQHLPCVRRLSGGGVLVHGGDLSYSIVLPRGVLKEKNVKENYRYLCRFLIRLYEKMGLKGEFAQDLGAEINHSDICLAGHEPYDILIGGKKMGGNAQRYTARTLFQHGTIPITLDDTLFEPFFREESGLKRSAALENLGVTVTRQALAEMAVESFCETFETTLLPGGLSAGEAQRARELLAQKYLNERWTFDGQQTMA